jgi:hypothetical protein
MKAALSVLATIASIVLGANALAQTSVTKAPGRTHSAGIAIEPTWLLIGGLGAKIDFRLSDRAALGLGGMYASRTVTEKNERTLPEGAYKVRNYEIYLGPTFNLTGNYDTDGFFITPAIGYTGAKIYDYSVFKLSGEINTWEIRTTAGYQWVVQDFRFIAGGGLKLLGDSEVVVKDKSGKEVLRQSSGSLGGLALDLHAAWLF